MEERQQLKTKVFLDTKLHNDILHFLFGTNREFPTPNLKYQIFISAAVAGMREVYIAVIDMLRNTYKRLQLSVLCSSSSTVLSCSLTVLCCSPSVLVSQISTLSFYEKRLGRKLRFIIICLHNFLLTVFSKDLWSN